MNNRRILFIVFVVCILIISIGGFIYLQTRQLVATEQFLLEVIVVHKYNKSPISNVWVEVISLQGQIIDKQSPDEDGSVTFQLPPGRYVIQIASGYTGRAEIDLNSKQSIELEVLSILG